MGADRADSERPVGFGKARSVLIVLLSGGPSQLDTLDPKPLAPAEVRGEFASISTTISGVEVCEQLPRLASQASRWAIVRTLSHREHNHLLATHVALSGRPTPVPREARIWIAWKLEATCQIGDEKFVKILGILALLFGLSFLVFAGLESWELQSAATSVTAPSADSIPLTKWINPELLDSGNDRNKPAELSASCPTISHFVSPSAGEPAIRFTGSNKNPILTGGSAEFEPLLVGRGPRRYP